MAEGNEANAITTTVEERDLSMERTFDAPRELVFRAFVEPQRLAHWWGPQGWSTTIYKMEVKPGGVWHYHMKGPAGEESWGRAVYHEIVPPEKLTYTDSFADKDGNVLQGMPETQVTMKFLDFEGKTRLVSRLQSASIADLERLLAQGIVEGVTEAWTRLGEYLGETK